MATTEILPFATGEDADVLSQAAYSALAARTDGFSVGIAEPAELNKVWRQASFIAAGLAEWCVSHDVDVPDDGDLAALVVNIQTAFEAAVSAELGELAGVRFKDVIDCSANPNYPAATAGDMYVVSVAGRIGGGSGPIVNVSDTLICKVTNGGGTHAAVGADWVIVEGNLGYTPLNPANNLSDVSSASTSRTNIGAAASGANTDITSVSLNQTGLQVKGASSNALTVKPNETLSTARTLNVVVNDADRTVDLSGNLTVNSGGATIGGTATGTNTGDQNLFSTIAVSGQSNVVADSTTDTLTLVAGSNITITTDASTDSVTITAAASSSPAQALAKAWLKCNASGSIQASYNITSIVDDGVGLITVTIATDFSSADYAVIGQARQEDNAIRFISVNTQAAGSFHGRCIDAGNVLSDPASWYFVCYGDQ